MTNTGNGMPQSQPAADDQAFSLHDCRTYTKLPAQDIDRAMRFYAEQLGLTPTLELAPRHFMYVCGGSLFLLFPSNGRPSGDHDQMGVNVPELDVAVRSLTERGVVFTRFAAPGDKLVGDVAENSQRRAAWIHDSEGNLISLTQRLGRTVLPSVQ